jgi:hypothetical protein
MTRPDYWLTKFSKLRVDRARGDPAAHKQPLLLVLCDLVEKELGYRGAVPELRGLYTREAGKSHRVTDQL